ncbi:radial spoke head 10 homolog B-like [Leguminivora glycinivorella]|uniref:radial spoke head 10 homolog B-like n=1 Tax=Leguminivora glycinivorella TaxID=1035111 RepID=UPI00200F4718|nr:radial spoke head 10 homolog B-like [Leguminivora glycinivorella]
MFYVDTQRTTTRRDSSLITTARSPDRDSLLSIRGQSSAHFGSDQGTLAAVVRPRGSVQRELVTSLFESNLKYIVDSWEIIEPEKPSSDIEKTGSEATLFPAKKKGKEPPAKVDSKSVKSKMVRSKSGSLPMELMTYVPWWSGPDERAIIHFNNGNLYEGNISMKCMNGEGRFQWADGTVYLGQFKNNEMVGKGMIQWKNDTWYEGEFACNLRHGRGLYVDSRAQGSYVGGWHLGTKHGVGALHYPGHSTNSYDGEWVHNVRHGAGSREYCHDSGYKGDWDAYMREGQGLMIWPNHDFYSGGWKNNVISGYGIYIWNLYSNNSMSMPSINLYRGEWHKGKRHGYGVLNFGYGLGSHYKGEFKDNLKHGYGKLVTNTGQIFRHKALFQDDNLGPHESENECDEHCYAQSLRSPHPKPPQVQKTIEFNICDSSLSLIYHIHQALKHIDREAEIRAHIIHNFIENNKYLNFNTGKHKDETPEENFNIDDLITFEETSLRKALRCYETELRKIYLQYAKICNTEEITFTPNLIRLYLWQLYFDCKIHEKGLTLVQIDDIFFSNPEWIARSPHNPFEKIHYWQFQHGLVTVASKLYAKTTFPGPKPDTILASAFRTFMDKDVLPGSVSHKGHLVNGPGVYVPLKALYSLYRSLGEPHTIRRFLCAALRPHHDLERPQPPLLEPPDEYLPIGRNGYVFEDDMIFTLEGDNLKQCPVEDADGEPPLKLFNFGNLSCKMIIKIFGRIFPNVFGNNNVLNVDIEITFYEFFEAFISCAEESVRMKEEQFKEAAVQTTYIPLEKVT